MADFDPTDYDGQNADDPLNEGRMSLARVHKWLGHRKETCAFQV